jgi:hypothetical protein
LYAHMNNKRKRKKKQGQLRCFSEIARARGWEANVKVKFRVHNFRNMYFKVIRSEIFFCYFNSLFNK